jgi:unsaturated chondroitin disaccharide hydrolase
MLKLTDKDQIWLQDLWNKLSNKLSVECDRIGAKIPYIAENGKYEDYSQDKIGWWTNGFWPGILWQMYEATGEDKYRFTACEVEEKLATNLMNFSANDHDYGFRWLLSSVANYRLTGDITARNRGMHAATLLAGRYNPIGEYIRAWDHPDRITWMIIDCLMNVPLLYWAGGETKDTRFDEIALRHVLTSTDALLRRDGSSNHVGIMDPITGAAVSHPGGQGYESGSSWSRGQAWAVYGFALSYHYKKEQSFIDAAKVAAHYFIANVCTTGYIPLLDFRAPETPVRYDTTAGLIAACGMIMLAQEVPEYEQELYLRAALNILKATEEKHCNWDPEYDSIVQNGSVMYHNNQIHVPIIYGDFFLLEAIRKLLGSDFLIW